MKNLHPAVIPVTLAVLLLGPLYVPDLLGLRRRVAPAIDKKPNQEAGSVAGTSSVLATLKGGRCIVRRSGKSGTSNSDSDLGWELLLEVVATRERYTLSARQDTLAFGNPSPEALNYSRYKLLVPGDLVDVYADGDVERVIPEEPIMKPPKSP